MKTTTVARSRAGWLFLSALSLALVASSARAEELTKFTGYTRPGVPTGPAGVIANAPADEASIGVTVYFRVFELGGDDPGDPWGTGFKNLEASFVPGQAARGRNSQRLDTSARYLYVYQVINDSYRDAQVRNVAIRLLVPPHLITSWGHFATKRDKTARGVGFSMLFDNPEPKNPNTKSRVLPVSTEHPGVTDGLYRDPAPYFHPPRPYGVTGIQLNNKPAPLTDGEDTGREPERVVLQSTWNFAGAPLWLVKDQVALPLSPFTRLALPASDLANPGTLPGDPAMLGMPGGMGVAPVLPGLGGVGAESMSEALRRAPAVVVYWTEDGLKPGRLGVQPGQRSTLFGFTSNFPPVYEDVRVRGDKPAAGGADAVAPSAKADGEVPTPVAFEQCAPPAHALGGLGGPLGTVGAGGGLLRGGGGFGGGFGGFGFGGGGFGGGGFGSGSPGAGLGAGSGGGNGNGSGNGNSTNNGQQAQSQQQNVPSPFFVINNQNVANAQQSQFQAQAQAQAQAQQQQQQQQQEQRQRRQRQVIPEPAAVVPALLGVPLLVWLAWRRRMLTALT